MRTSYSYKLLSPYFVLGKGNKLFQEQERLINREAFFSAASQREIIAKTKIPQQTISRLVKSLMERNALSQSSKSPSGSRGQPGFLLTANSDFAYSIGIAILMDGLALAIMDYSGSVVYNNRIHLSDVTVENMMSHLTTMMDNAIDHSDIKREKILGIGVGISGYFTDQDSGINTHSNLNDWASVNIAQLLTEQFKLPVWVENDAKAAAAGEGIDGVGKTYSNFVYLFISTAFGGGIIAKNDIMHGTHGNAGEVGDILPPKRYIHPNLENLRQILIANDVEISTIDDMLTNFDINWPGVNEWVYKVQDALSLVATASAAILDTQAIVIGGHIPRELAELLIKNTEVYTQHRRDSARLVPNLITAQSQHEPVSIGAASIPIRELCL